MNKKVGLIIIVICILIVIMVILLLVIGNEIALFSVKYEEHIDSDGDGYDDDVDAFPTDPTEWEDFDNDGIGDNSDIYDYGDIAVVVFVSHYEADAQIDENTAFPDPYFIINVGLKKNEWSFQKESTEMKPNIHSWDNPIAFIVDIPDNHQGNIFFRIEVMDIDEFTSDEPLDYRGADSEFWTTHEYDLFEFELTVSDSGYDDNIMNETNCYLEYGIMTGIL